MGLRTSLIDVAGAGLLACATQDRNLARADEAATLARASETQPMALEKTGVEAAAWGDKWTSANLFERSLDKDNSLAARFNLAHV